MGLNISRDAFRKMCWFMWTSWEKEWAEDIKDTWTKFYPQVWIKTSSFFPDIHWYLKGGGGEGRREEGRKDEWGYWKTFGFQLCINPVDRNLEAVFIQSFKILNVKAELSVLLSPFPGFLGFPSPWFQSCGHQGIIQTWELACQSKAQHFLF